MDPDTLRTKKKGCLPACGPLSFPSFWASLFFFNGNGNTVSGCVVRDDAGFRASWKWEVRNLGKGFVEMDLEGLEKGAPGSSSPPLVQQDRPGLFRPTFWGTSLVLVLLDLGSKAWAFTFLSQNAELRYSPRHTVIDGFFYLAKVENKGTVWGLFQNGTLPLTFVRILMVAALLFFAYRIRSGGIKLLALGMILGGALGNLYDNLFWHGGVFFGGGAVRDFLDFYLPIPFKDQAYHWPTFNIADASILVGAFLLFIALHREERQKIKTAKVSGEVQK